MSSKVILRPHNFIPYTLVPNFFIDGFLAKANGEFIKVYLVLLRYMSVGQLDFDLGQIADHLLMTESDVLRALNYFQSENLLTLNYTGNQLSEIHLSHLQPTEPDFPSQPSFTQSESYSRTESYQHTPGHDPNAYNKVYQEDTYRNQDSYTSRELSEAPNTYQRNETGSSHLKVISSKPDYTTKEIAYFAEAEDFNQLLYITQKYLGKTLSSNEVKTIVSFHDWLGLPIDVIELLIEYCVGNDHRNMRYIEKVAMDWADNSINTIEKAKVRTETYNKSYFIILKAYGITDRSPTPNQIRLMDKWLNEYQLDIDVIVEACERTIAQINKAEMRYTDSILNTWYKEKVRTIKDIDRLDASRPKQNYTQAGQNQTSKPNKFNNYAQRDYDYDELEKKALELRLRESGGKRYSS